jgi:hypothetical protein
VARRMRFQHKMSLKEDFSAGRENCA